MSANLSVTELLTPLDPDVMFNQWMQALEDVGIPSSSWATGGPMRTIMRIIAQSIVAVWTVIIAAISGGFLATATGNWLTLLAYYVYGVTRIQATFAQGFVTLTNSGGGIYHWDAGGLIVQNSGTKATYVNVDAVDLAAGQTLANIPIIAQAAGSASTSPATTIDTLATPARLVTVTNPADVVGLDAQDDTDLVTTCLEHNGAMSLLGPRDAYFYAVRTANDNGNPVNINRRTVSPSSSTGQVLVICASPDGTPSSDDLTAVATNIEAIARPDTATVTVQGATVVASSQTITVYATQTAGLDAPTLETLVEDAVTALVEGYDIGGKTKPPATQGYLFATDLTIAAGSAHPAIYAVDGFTDIPLSAGQVAEVTVDITVRLVPTQAAA